MIMISFFCTSCLWVSIVNWALPSVHRATSMNVILRGCPVKASDVSLSLSMMSLAMKSDVEWSSCAIRKLVFLICSLFMSLGLNHSYSLVSLGLDSLGNTIHTYSDFTFLYR